MTTTIETPGFLTFTISIVVFFVGSGLNRGIAPLRRWNVPEAVTGGLVISFFLAVDGTIGVQFLSFIL
jgi:ESS family glutamate:Na+ symporter